MLMSPKFLLSLIGLGFLVACGSDDDNDTSELEQRLANLENANTALTAQVSDLEAANLELHERLSTVEHEALTVEDLSSEFGISGNLSAVAALNPYLEVDTTTHTVAVVGANLSVRSGTGSTEGDLNGLGNLIVGYNESESDTRTGSHNLIVGTHHSYDGFGGIVGGYDNATSSPYATVAGGRGNTASGNYAFIGGGYQNFATDGLYTAILGGEANIAIGNYSTVAGGSFNEASGVQAAIAGGREGVASAYNSTVSGGLQNESSADYATVSGGAGLVASTQAAHAAP